MTQRFQAWQRLRDSLSKKKVSQATAQGQESRESLLGPTMSIPAVPHLHEQLRSFDALRRHPMVAAIKELKKSEWDRLHQWYVERINEVTGFDMALSLTAVVDTILGYLINRAVKSANAPEDWAQHVGFYAIGGYGRAEFNPYSDLDVMVITKRTWPDWVRDVNAEFQTLLWDCGFQVGASLRSLPELENILRDDYVTATALLEHRPLQASSELNEGLASLLQRFRTQRTPQYLRYKVEELQGRRKELGESLFTMEPNLKTSPGCLRDVQFLRNLSYMLFGSRSLHALRELDTIGPHDVQELFAINDHLMGLRSLQHFHHGHRQDQFLLADQLRCARQLGYGSQASLREVEVMMRDHYHKMVTVVQIVSLCIDRIRSLGFLGPQRSLLATRRPLCDGFVVIDGAVYLSRRNFLQGPHLARHILQMACLAQKQGVRCSISLQRSIAQHLQSNPQLDRRDPESARLFMALLAVEGKVAPILRDLHGAGFLGAYLPEFGRITCHMQFDAYHHYTVDEHTLIALEYLDAIARCDSFVPAVLRQVNSTVRRHDLLALGLLLHDVGKYMGRGHIARGELMVGPVCRRLGLSEEDEDCLRFLVREHVTLSSASRSRDLSDPQLLQQLATRIGSVERLDMLYCLTWPDAKAVGPKILTGWQESLLEECYLALRAQLEGRTQATGTKRQTMVDALVKSGLEDKAAAFFLSLMPSEYVHQVTATFVDWHYLTMQRVRQQHVACAADVRAHEDHWTLLLALPDRVNLLADTASICCGYGLDIVGCRVWVTRDQYALLSLRVTGVVSGRWKDAQSWQRLFETFAELSGGGVNQAEWIERRRQMILPEPICDSQIDDVEVKADDSSSDDMTVLDVRGKDRPGLLARICQSIADLGCRIELAQVATMGDQAVDVFYVSMDGNKLDASATRRLCSAVTKVLTDES